MNPARATGTFLRTRRSEWAGLSRAPGPGLARKERETSGRAFAHQAAGTIVLTITPQAVPLLASASTRKQPSQSSRPGCGRHLAKR